jgi:serine/threonine protein kinase
MPTVREAGAEPLPGYRLIEPLGSGGFGEVWKCEAPGGFLKAIKFVNGNLEAVDEDSEAAQQELAALQHIKAIRHPFILSTERVEILDGELLIVMELADKNLHSVFTECRQAGLPGIPRDELLALLMEAAEALDWMNFQHGLQHLDIKPANLFLVSGHAKVADFGLVNPTVASDASPNPSYHGGTTPRYAPPEILQGFVSRNCDQYSLAIVYQQLLTGTLPFDGKNGRQLMLQHLTAVPDLAALPSADQAVVERALVKDPEKRFPSCLGFIEALVELPSSATPLPERNGARLRRTVLAVRRTPDVPRELEQTPGDRTPLTRKVRRPTEEPSPPSPPPPAERKPDRAADRAPAPIPVPAVTPAARESLPGYEMLECLGVGPLGPVWSVRSPDGCERWARLLLPAAGTEDRLMDRLRALRHPGLVRIEVIQSSSGRPVLVSDRSGQTLQERFAECVAQGLPGIPRNELLGYLEEAAETLDDLRERHGLRHLGLNPCNLVVDEGRLRLADFGLVELLWVADGRSPAEVNGRHAPPEGGPPGEHAGYDVYSLAVIYAEMLTGVYPRPARRSGRTKTARTAERLELDLLPASDREAIGRALHADPAQRFATCTELLDALRPNPERAAAAGRRAAPELAPVIPVAWLSGEPAPAEMALPHAKDLVARWVPAAVQAGRQGGGGPAYQLTGADRLEHRCVVQQFPYKMMRLKMKAYRQRCRAEPVHEDETSYRLRLAAPTNFWQRCVGGGQAGLEVRVQFRPLSETNPPLLEAQVVIEPYGGRGGRLAGMLRDLGPKLVEGLHRYLPVVSDRRGGERWPFAHPASVYPVADDGSLAEPIEGESCDLSLGGLGLRLRQAPTGDRVYVHLSPGEQPAPFAILGRVVRVLPQAGGWYRVSVRFAADEPGADAEQPAEAVSL